ncbi:MAG: 4Fe-4S binding protein, partial [Spirochaetaceae bacterium]|nr:4Fe-4S binding protein [Spirochaetaceae bacterium]
MATSASKPKKGLARRLRLAVQIFFFVLVAFAATTSGLKESGVELPWSGEASLHAVCPFGGVVSFWQLATLGTLVKKVHDSSVVLAVIGVVLAILFGPVLCGWICPFGSVQEWIGKIGKKIFKKRYNTFVPHSVDKVLRFLRYVVLLWVSYMTIVTGKLAFEANVLFPRVKAAQQLPRGAIGLRQRGIAPGREGVPEWPGDPPTGEFPVEIPELVAAAADHG